MIDLCIKYLHSVMGYIPIPTMRIFFILFLWIGFSSQVQGVERYIFPAYSEEVQGRPLEIILSKLIQAYQDSRYLEPESRSHHRIYQKERDRALEHILEEGILQEFTVFLERGDPLQTQALREISQLLVSRVRFQSPKDQSLRDLSARILEKLPPASLSASYEYAYGKELERKSLKEFDAIHRKTLFENREHKIEIDIDFLGPLKKLIEALKVKEKFSWVWAQKLRFAYRAFFKHHKRIFTRSVGYYEKVSVKIELLRRKRSFWGTGPWESYGYTYLTREEPRALITTEARELPSEN